MRHEAKPHRTAVGQHRVVVLDVDRRGLESRAGAMPKTGSVIVVAVAFGALLSGRLMNLALDGGIARYGHTIVAAHATDASGLALAVTVLVLQHRLT